MSKRKTARFGIRLDEDERAWIDNEAARRDLESTSSYLRMLVRKARAASLGDQPRQRDDVQHEAA